jgi:hypothetical protein
LLCRPFQNFDLNFGAPVLAGSARRGHQVFEHGGGLFVGTGGQFRKLSKLVLRKKEENATFNFLS